MRMNPLIYHKSHFFDGFFHMIRFKYNLVGIVVDWIPSHVVQRVGQNDEPLPA